MIINNDCLAAMRDLPDNSVHACIASPPYFGLCDYQVDGQYGHEQTIGEYLTQMTVVFAEVKRLLVEGGTCWIVIGDSSNNYSAIRAKGERRSSTISKRRPIQKEQCEKAIMNVPIKLGMQLEADGWVYRNNLIWNKISAGTIAKSDTAPQTHEYILQMGKWSSGGRPMLNSKAMTKSVLTYPPVSDPLHPCPYPIGLAAELIEAATEPGQTVLDCFAGTGTTLLAAHQTGRQYIGIELNPKYCTIAESRLSQVQLPLLFAA
jgi:site-specific DNA-methyltransferase (cytosine-N4-specific)